MQSKNMNMHEKYTSQSLAKKAINKFMIIRYRLQSIYYVYFVENKQRKTKKFNICNFLLIKYINSTFFKILARARARVDGLVCLQSRSLLFFRVDIYYQMMICHYWGMAHR